MTLNNIIFKFRYIPKRQLESSKYDKSNNTFISSYSTSHEWSTAYLNINNTGNQHIYNINISGLSKMEHYIFSVSANNTSGFGWGSESQIIVYTIDSYHRSRPDPPNKPMISQSSIKTNELIINWNINSENYSPIRYFTIQINELKFENIIFIILIFLKFV